MSDFSSDKKWKKYYGTWRPVTPPDVSADIKAIQDGTLWNEGAPYARWTSHWDVPVETDFWYCIKDTPFDISDVKSKRRYYLKKGESNFNVKQIETVEYLKEIYEITDSALRSYVDYNGPEDYETFKKRMISRKDIITLGAFSKESGGLCGFINVKEYDNYVDFMTLKVDPSYEKQQINAALVYGLLKKYNNLLNKEGFYINDGMRAINHRTNFQEYLMKYFNFRLAYCQLNVAYNPKLEMLVKLAFPFRKIIKRMKGNFSNKVSVILTLEEISRNTKMQVDKNYKERKEDMYE